MKEVTNKILLLATDIIQKQEDSSIVHYVTEIKETNQF